MLPHHGGGGDGSDGGGCGDGGTNSNGCVEPCERDPRCTRGFKHQGRGGRCSYSSKAAAVAGVKRKNPPVGDHDIPPVDDRLYRNGHERGASGRVKGGYCGDGADGRGSGSQGYSRSLTGGAGNLVVNGDASVVPDETRLAVGDACLWRDRTGMWYPGRVSKVQPAGTIVLPTHGVSSSTTPETAWIPRLAGRLAPLVTYGRAVSTCDGYEHSRTCRHQSPDHQPLHAALARSPCTHTLANLTPLDAALSCKATPPPSGLADVGPLAPQSFCDACAAAIARAIASKRRHKKPKLLATDGVNGATARVSAVTSPASNGVGRPSTGKAADSPTGASAARMSAEHGVRGGSGRSCGHSARRSGGGRGSPGGGRCASAISQCERHPDCTRGYKHGGRGGHCSLGGLNGVRPASDAALLVRIDGLQAATTGRGSSLRAARTHSDGLASPRAKTSKHSNDGDSDLAAGHAPIVPEVGGGRIPRPPNSDVNVLEMIEHTLPETSLLALLGRPCRHIPPLAPATSATDSIASTASTASTASSLASSAAAITSVGTAAAEEPLPLTAFRVFTSSRPFLPSHLLEKGADVRVDPAR